MTRNLDLTSLRSLVTVYDLGGVTRAAGFLHLTQSAVSMQLKRLEENLGIALIDRSARNVALTSQGEQLIGYARQMLALNDEVVTRLMHHEHVGELVLGVPHDIVYPVIPQILRRFNREYPRVRVQLVSSFTTSLRAQYDKGECDLIMTTEDATGEGGEQLTRLPLVWVGARDGVALKSRPLQLAFEQRCLFRERVQGALNAAGIPWEMATETEQTRTIEAVVSADLAVHAMIEGAVPPHAEVIDHRGLLPELGDVGINLYCQTRAKKPGLQDLADMIRQAYGVQNDRAGRPDVELVKAKFSVAAG